MTKTSRKGNEMAALGFMLFIIGACGMDSTYRVIPTLFLAAGLALLFHAVRRVNE